MLRVCGSIVTATVVLMSIGCAGGGSMRDDNRMDGNLESGTDAANANETIFDPIELGRMSVERRNCAQCHQSASPADGILSGQTVFVPLTMAYGKNLTSDPDTGIDWSDDQLATALRLGIDDDGATLCPTMPRMVDLNDTEVHRINLYLHSLPPVHREIPDSVCP